MAFLACLGASAAPADAAAQRRAALVIDANTGRVLYAEAADAQRYPASLTKMMTLYLVFEAMESRRLTPSTPIRFSSRAASAQPSKLGIEEGETITVRQAILALITKSANDVAIAVAEHLAGSEAQFARQMTAKARALGMYRTVFRNASGLPDAEQVTTARDMVTLSLALMDHFPEHYRLFRTRSYSHDGRTHRNHNTLLGTFEGTDGIKTGYTRASGFNLASSVRRGPRHLVGVIFGGRTAGSRNAEMRALLLRSFGRASISRTRRPIARDVPLLLAAKPRPALRPAPRARPALVEPVREAARRYEPGPAIAIARVRTVNVLAPQTQASARSAPVQRVAAEPSFDGPSMGETAADAPNRIPASLFAELAGLKQPPTPARLRLAAAPQSITTDTPQPLLGRSPSTLNAQHVSLVRSAGPSPRHALAKPSATANDDGFSVQIGAYPSQLEAERQLERVKRVARASVGGLVAATIPVSVKGRQLYRARYVGLEASRATDICDALRQRGIDCFVARQ